MRAPQGVCPKKNSARPLRSLRLRGELFLWGISPQRRRVCRDCAEKKTIFPGLASIFGVVPLSVSFLAGCREKPIVAHPPIIEKPKPPTAVPMWLGNAERNFYGTGPWKDGELKVIWDFKTGATRGRFHPDPWGGSGWPGQPAIVGDRVYFGSADSYVYCLNKTDGSLIWKYKTTAGGKSSPCVDGN